MAATIEQVNMTEGALLPKIIRFSLPLAATGVLQLLFNAADVIVVGKFAGATALAAVGATTALVALLVNALMSISVGVNILVARYLGCREHDRVRTCVHTVFALSFVLGLIVMVAGSHALDAFTRAHENAGGRAAALEPVPSHLFYRRSRNGHV